MDKVVQQFGELIAVLHEEDLIRIKKRLEKKGQFELADLIRLELKRREEK